LTISSNHEKWKTGGLTIFYPYFLISSTHKSDRPKEFVSFTRHPDWHRCTRPFFTEYMICACFLVGVLCILFKKIWEWGRNITKRWEGFQNGGLNTLKNIHQCCVLLIINRCIYWLSLTLLVLWGKYIYWSIEIM